ncbi:MAG: transcriptional repressor [Elusimicrobia bacterium]|jgi:Fur family ferric uptake transcriptional regulator|nr:transcriptional repressor [Elusimicrobiota bacterium]MBK7207389.1 transcriptional repressor [Elusimicrobiota bacterium]MBK7544157.1 transcriptional repressor [Elusimicrobiota bacterium]MBK7573679.1 transcriptional repressor [Elusimicrobiota bacterium]MBK7688431.1 transcriptional repressor [Elusimicrobiota bacterium]
MVPIASDLRLAFAQEGKRWTGARETVLSVLEKSALPISAKDIFKQVHSSGVNLASIYRTTEMLAERGIAIQVESRDGVRRFELSDRYRPHHHHVVCRDCGETRDVSGCGVKGIEARAARSTGFKIVGHQLSLTGLCPRCY